MLKSYLERLLGDISKDSEHYALSRNILEKISEVKEIPSSLIGDESIYKEFV